MESKMAEGLYLDRLPWEHAYESAPDPVADQEAVREELTFFLEPVLELGVNSDALHPLPSWTEDEWPFLHRRLARHVYPDIQQFCYWLPGQTRTFGAAFLEQAVISGDKSPALEIFGGAKRREDAFEAASSPAAARTTKPASTNYRARLSLLPRFMKEVLAHPFSDFTLLKRGSKVFVVEEGVDLSGQDLRGVDLYRANLRRADLRGADLSEAVLKEADLRGADLRDAVLNDTDLREADLRGIQVDKQLLSQAVTDGALLNGSQPAK